MSDKPWNQPGQPAPRQQVQPGDLAAGPPKDPPAPGPFEARCARLGLPPAEDVAAAGPDELPALLGDLDAEQLDALHVREVNAHDEWLAKSKERLRAIRRARDRKAGEQKLRASLDNLTAQERADFLEMLRERAGEQPAPQPDQVINAPGAPGRGK